MNSPQLTRPAVATTSGYFAPLAQQVGRLSAEDRLAIADLVLRFEWCFDSRDYVALADMLTDDAVIDHIWGYREGRDAVIQLLVEWEHANVGLRHQGTNLVVWAEDDRTAAAHSYLVGITMTGPLTDDSAAPEYRQVAGHGLVTDRFRREQDGIWRMTRRTIEQMYIAPDYLPDEQARRWFAQTADERMRSADKPAGWLQALSGAQS